MTPPCFLRVKILEQRRKHVLQLLRLHGYQTLGEMSDSSDILEPGFKPGLHLVVTIA